MRGSWFQTSWLLPVVLLWTGCKDSDFDGVSPSFGTVVVHVLIDGPNPTGNAPAGKYSAELH